MDANEIVQLTRRDFLLGATRGVGALAFAALLGADGLLAADAKNLSPSGTFNPLTPRPPWCVC